jgi:hypothetical protein
VAENCLERHCDEDDEVGREEIDEDEEVDVR